MQRPRGALHPIVDEHEIRHDHADRAQRQLEVEQHPPIGVVEQIAADHRTERERRDRCEAERRDHVAAPLGRRRTEQDGERDRLQRAAAEPLQHAKDDQRADGRRGAAQQRHEGEQAERGKVVPLLTEPGGEPAVERHDDHHAERVAGRNPRREVGRGAEVAGDRRDRNVDDRRVEHAHQHADHDGDDDQQERRRARGPGHERSSHTPRAG